MAYSEEMLRLVTIENFHLGSSPWEVSHQMNAYVYQL